MCAKHLEEFFGLEMGYYIHETETSFKYIGGFLKPKPGVVFSKNTVLIPTRHFFDSYYRPEDKRDSIDIEYKMNPVIHTLISHLANLSENNVNRRYPIEIIRNLTHVDVNTGPEPNQMYLLRNVITMVTSNKTVSEVQIQTQSISKCFEDFGIRLEAGLKNYRKLSDLKEVSTCMKYLFLNCLFTEHAIDKSISYTDSIMYNTKWIPEIGLVTTEDVADPHFLVIHGYSFGSQIYYNAVVSTVKKDVLQKKTTLKDVPSQYYLANAFRGGSEDCLF